MVQTVKSPNPDSASPSDKRRTVSEKPHGIG